MTEEEKRKKLFNEAMARLQGSGNVAGMSPTSLATQPAPPGSVSYENAISRLIGSGNVDFSSTNQALADFNSRPTTVPQQDNQPLFTGTPLTMSDAPFSSTSTAPEESKGALWKRMLGSFSGLGSGVTQTIYDTVGDAKDTWNTWNDGKFNWKDIWSPINTAGKILPDVANNFIVQPVKKQIDEWKDGINHYEDIPVLGALSDMTRDYKHGSDILGDQFGVKNGAAKFWGGLGVDILTDPLTYATFGASGAVKAAGTTAAKIAAEGADVIPKALRSTVPFTKIPLPWKRMNTYDILNQIGKQAGEPAEFAARESVNAARGNAQNSLLSVGLPFMNNAIGIGSKPVILQKLFNKIVPLAGKTAGLNMLEKLSKFNMSENELMKFLQEKYNVGSVDEMTMPKIKHFERWINRIEVPDTPEVPDVFAGASEAAQAAPTPEAAQASPNPAPEAEAAQMAPEAAQVTPEAAPIPEAVQETPTPTYAPPTKGARSNTPHQSSQAFHDLMDSFDNQTPAAEEQAAGREGVLNDLGEAKQSRPMDEVIQGLAQAGHSKNEIIANILQMHDYADFNHTPEFYKFLSNKIDKLIGTGTEHAAGVADEASAGYKALMDKLGVYQGGEWNNPSRFARAFGLDRRALSNAKDANGNFDHYVSDSANILRDRDSQAFGRYQDMNRVKGIVDKLAKEFKLTDADHKINDKDFRELMYIMEDKKPANYVDTLSPERKAQLEEMAKRLKDINDEMARQEIGAGTLDPKNVQPNYATHFHPRDIPDSNLADSPFSGKSANNRFNNNRKSFHTLADAEDYKAGLDKDMKAAMDAGNADEVGRLQEHIDEYNNRMFDTNIVESSFARWKDSIRTVANKQRNDALMNMGLIIKKGEAAPYNTKAGMYHPLGAADVNDMKALGLHQGDEIHTEVYEALKKINDLFTDKNASKALDMAQSITNIWKASVTILKPVHFLNNFYGNVFNNLLAGVRLDDYSRSTALMKAFHAGTMTEDQAKIMQQAIDHGIIGQGFTAEFKRYYGRGEDLNKMSHRDIVKSLVSGKSEDFSKGLKGAEYKARNFAEKRWWAKGGVSIENMTRLANFMHGLSTTGDAAKAAAQVRKYLFNYHEMTQMDKGIRALVPFWMWTRNNLPLQFGQFFKNTRIYENFVRIKDGWDKQTGATDLPDWAKDSRWRIPGTKYGIPINLPLSDLDYANPNLSAMARKAGSNLHFIPKSIIEGALNKSMFTGKPIVWKGVAPDGTIANHEFLKYLGSQTGIPSNLWKIASGIKDAATADPNLGRYKGHLSPAEAREQATFNILAPLIGKPYKFDDSRSNQTPW